MTILLAAKTLDLAHIHTFLVGGIGYQIRVRILLECSLCEKTLLLAK
jgi:hypothetical protein